MRTLLTVVLAMLWTLANAQSAMRPSDLVEARIKNNVTFKTIHLFERAPELRSEPQVINGLWMFLNTASIIPLQRERPLALSLPLPNTDGTMMELELVQVDIFSADFVIQFSQQSNTPSSKLNGLFYQGRIKGRPESMAAISIFNNEVTGVISTPEEGNRVLGRYKGADPRLHILHADEKMAERPEFHCLSPDNESNYRPEELQPQAELRSAAACVRLYLEVDNDVFIDKGGQDGTLQYVTGIFNQVAALYANENIRLSLSQVFIWNSSSPYTGSDTYTILTQFQRTRTSFNGDAAELITYKGGGGIAVVDGLCRPYNSFKMGVAGVGRFFSNLPTYSFSVMVVAHELGHILGSQHTHACVWNGNNTAIDACAGYTEGNCSATESTPSGGGTIMSYCHLNTVGINFSKGFGTQPGNLIRNRIAAATCLQVCTTDGGGGGNSGGGGNNATCGEVVFQMTLDLFGSETTWEILNPAGVAVEKGGPYVDKTLGQKIERKVCLPFGCYALKIYDKHNDGICCSYGEGSYRLLNANNVEISKGAVFGNLAQTNFCVSAPDNGGGNPPVDSKCVSIDFNRYPPISFGGSQDGGSASIADAGKTLVINNNAWKAVAINYAVTTKTFLEFEFRSTQLGEIHGIGFDDDENISSPYTFQLWGSQTWGIADYRNYTGNGQWKKYTIPVGKFYTGTFNRLFFAVDKDAAPFASESQFRNVRIYEETPCPGFQEPSIDLDLSQLTQLKNLNPEVLIAPNPSDVSARFSLLNWPVGQYKLSIFDALGRKILNNYPLNINDSNIWEWQLSTTNWSSGVYFYVIHNDQVKKSGKMLISRPNN
ncbi:M12 family metallo-peptidase [Haliscomenobacter sp.]|uniref:M12 family metallo-peptidase n=1 Tax=Haliscomenobacter sp. TaxID=2717303 RepID=UPI003BA8FBC9